MFSGLAALLLLFFLLHFFTFFRRLLASRMYMNDPHAPHKPMARPFDWVVPVLKATEADIIECAGLDAAVYLRMFQFSIQLFGVLSLLCLPVLLPLNAVSSLMLYAVSITTFLIIWWTYRHVWGLRHDYLASRAKVLHPEEYVVLVTDVPQPPKLRQESSVGLFAPKEGVVPTVKLSKPAVRRLFTLLRICTMGAVQPPQRADCSSASAVADSQFVDRFFSRLYPDSYLNNQGVASYGKVMRAYARWRHAVQMLDRTRFRYQQSLERNCQRKNPRPEEELVPMRRDGLLRQVCALSSLEWTFSVKVSLKRSLLLPFPLLPAVPLPCTPPLRLPPPHQYLFSRLWEPSITYWIRQVEDASKALKEAQRTASARRLKPLLHFSSGVAALLSTTSAIPCRLPSPSVLFPSLRSPSQTPLRLTPSPPSAALPLLFAPRRTGAAFVAFRKRRSSAVAVQTAHALQGSAWLVHRAPEPRDVVWQNLEPRFWERRIRTQVANGIFVCSVVFFYLPVTAASFLISFDTLAAIFPPLKDIDQNGWLYKGLTLILPAVGLRVCYWIAPPLMVMLSYMQGCLSTSAAERLAAERFYYILLCNIFFGFFFTTSVLQQIQLLLEQPSYVLEILGKSVPSTSGFYLSYVMTSTIIFGVELLRLPLALFIYLFRVLFTGVAIADREKLWNQGGINYHIFFPYQNLVITIGLVYAVIAPIILPFVCFYSCIGYLVWKHQIMYVYSYPYQTGGLLWIKFVGHVNAALIIAQVTVIGIFVIKQAYLPAAAAAPLPFVTFYFMALIHAKFTNTFQFLPLELAVDVDEYNQSNDMMQRMDDMAPEYMPFCMRPLHNPDLSPDAPPSDNIHQIINPDFYVSPLEASMVEERKLSVIAHSMSLRRGKGSESFGEVDAGGASRDGAADYMVGRGAGDGGGDGDMEGERDGVAAAGEGVEGREGGWRWGVVLARVPLLAWLGRGLSKASARGAEQEGGDADLSAAAGAVVVAGAVGAVGAASAAGAGGGSEEGKGGLRVPNGTAGHAVANGVAGDSGAGLLNGEKADMVGRVEGVVEGTGEEEDGSGEQVGGEEEGENGPLLRHSEGHGHGHGHGYGTGASCLCVPIVGHVLDTSGHGTDGGGPTADGSSGVDVEKMPMIENGEKDVFSCAGELGAGASREREMDGREEGKDKDGKKDGERVLCDHSSRAEMRSADADGDTAAGETAAGGTAIGDTCTGAGGTPVGGTNAGNSDGVADHAVEVATGVHVVAASSESATQS
ncbi:unnamed protein product [Closterium sp. NIES-65]|nr:unnamed protein product [Closterium sp. NIES-65]